MKVKLTLNLARTVVMLLVMLCSLGASADDITAEQAQKEALAFLQKQRTATGGPRYAPGKTPKLKLASTVSGLYVFNVDSNGGYVIVSNDDETIPVLGFSDSGSLDPNNMPDNMKAWLQGYANEIAWLKANVPVNGNGKGRRRVGSHSTGEILPLMTTTWNQEYPYNAYSPEYASGLQSVTGCIATAMAQVMYYTEKKAGSETTATTRDIPSYRTYSYQIDMPVIPEGTEINWKDMINNYSSSYTEENAEAVAMLMYCCGCATEMDYGPTSGSCTVRVANALKKYFGYAETTRYLCRSWYSFGDWTDIIYHELEEGRTVCYAGMSGDEGHGFVCDGYKNEDDTDLFHINWGWGGLSDGYFVLSALDPDDQGVGGSSSNSGYNYGQEAIVGIQKIGGTGTVLERNTYEVQNLKFNSITANFAKIALGESVDITVNVSNTYDKTFDGDLYLVVNNYVSVGKTFVIPGGETKDCTITFTPEEVGDYTIGIAYCSPAEDVEYYGGYHSENNFETSLTVVDQTPTNFTVSHITRETATFNWTNVGDAKEWRISYKPVDITTEDFDGSAEDIFKEGNWVTVDANKKGACWEVSPSEGLDGSACLKSASYKEGQNINPFVFLLSPKIDFSSLVSFWAWGSSDGVERFSVMVSTDGHLYEKISDLYTAGTTPKQYTFDLEPYIDEGSSEGTQGNIAIVHMNSTGSTSESYLYIDDVNIMNITDGTFQVVTDEYPYIMEGFEKQQTYEVMVQAYNNDGGQWSDPVIFTTTDDRFSLAKDDSGLPVKNQELVEAWHGMKTEVTLEGRTLYKDGKWNTICLPFSVSTAAGPLAGATVRQLSTASLADGTLTLNFAEPGSSSIQAGTPYIIKWESGEDIVNPVFTNVTIDKTMRDFTSDDTKVQFLGTYTPLSFNAENRSILYLGTSNTLYYPQSGASIGACHSYFQLDGSSPVKEFKLNFNDDDATGLTPNPFPVGEGSIYNLSGQKLSKPQKGVFIKNGRKVLF
ncbi:MAG: C10 family peptidase [Bacteroidaceae bacterium]|nr:C10 family peptidase [Bacteroidaceae bacterium]